MKTKKNRENCMFKRIAFNLVVNLHLEKTMVFVVAVQKLSRYN